MLSIPINTSTLLKQTVHRFATCWIIERTDGVCLYGTDHNSNIYYDGNVFESDAGLTVSASTKRENLNTRERDITAVLSDDRITHSDLRAGKYKKAKITQYLLDWKYPWVGPFETSIFWIVSTKFTDTVYEATVEGLTRYLRPEVGRVYTRDERLANNGSLADARGDLADWKVTGTVQAVTGFADFGFGDETVDGRLRVRITANKHSTVTNSADDYYDSGQLIVTSGNNMGVSIDIVNTVIVAVYSTTFDIQLKLATESAYTFEIGDTVELISGYDGSFEQAKNKFSNPEGFRGFPYIPGSDIMMRTPNAK